MTQYTFGPPQRGVMGACVCGSSFAPTRWLVVLIASFLGAFASASSEESIPSKPVRLVVPYPPGGGTDILARQVAEKISARPGRTIIVENRPGANGVIATEAVVKAAADGTVLLFAPTSVIAANPHLYPVAFDVLRDLMPIAQVATGQFVLVANRSVLFNTVDELIAAAKAAPGKLVFASAGSGSHAHLLIEMLKGAAAIEVLHVPYKGGAPAMTDLLGGQVQLFFDVVPTVLPHVRSGKLKALGVSRANRAPILPDVPPIAQTIPDFNTGPWYGAFGPSSLPSAMVVAFNREFAEAVRTADLQKRLIEAGYETETISPDDFRKLVHSDFVLFGRLIKTY